MFPVLFLFSRILVFSFFIYVFNCPFSCCLDFLMFVNSGRFLLGLVSSCPVSLRPILLLSWFFYIFIQFPQVPLACMHPVMQWLLVFHCHCMFFVFFIYYSAQLSCVCAISCHLLYCLPSFIFFFWIFRQFFLFNFLN